MSEQEYKDLARRDLDLYQHARKRLDNLQIKILGLKERSISSGGRVPMTGKAWRKTLVPVVDEQKQPILNLKTGKPKLMSKPILKDFTISVQTQPNPQAREDLFAEIDYLEFTYLTQAREAERICRTIETKISEVFEHENTLNMLLYYRYCCRKGFFEIATLLNYSESYVKHKHSEALIIYGKKIVPHSTY